MNGGNIGFGTALENLIEGESLTREGWNAGGQWVRLQVPDENSKMSLPYFYLHTAQGELVPWVPSVSDLLSHDWTVTQTK